MPLLAHGNGFEFMLPLGLETTGVILAISVIAAVHLKKFGKKSAMRIVSTWLFALVVVLLAATIRFFYLVAN